MSYIREQQEKGTPLTQAAIDALIMTAARSAVTFALVCQEQREAQQEGQEGQEGQRPEKRKPTAEESPEEVTPDASKKLKASKAPRAARAARAAKSTTKTPVPTIPVDTLVTHWLGSDQYGYKVTRVSSECLFIQRYSEETGWLDPSVKVLQWRCRRNGTWVPVEQGYILATWKGHGSYSFGRALNFQDPCF